MAANLLGLLANLRMFKVTKWDEDSNVTYSKEEREPAPISDVNVSTSIREDVDAWDGKPVHAVLLDLDVPAYLVPSSTPGNSHLYIDVRVPEDRYFRLLDALTECGVIQPGYANSSKHRGGTALRLPWVKKPEAALATVTDLPF